MKAAAIYVLAQDWDAVEALPQAWGQPPQGWGYARRLILENETPYERRGEPVEVDVDFHDGQITDLSRELRVARIDGDAGPITKVPRQVYSMAREDEIRRWSHKVMATVTYFFWSGQPSWSRSSRSSRTCAFATAAATNSSTIVARPHSTYRVFRRTSSVKQ